ncbi:MAG: HD domain-containing protein [Candidatus Giovannonibacteria bacterium]|nr:MAG: HD domain-containing protein [Candidatus Giovannonibacteria bacterium]
MKTWERYPNLARAVKRTHEEVEREFNVQAFHCHDFFHAFRVSNWAERIAPDPETARKAGVAGLLHNDDRIMQIKLGLGFADKVPTDLRVEMMISWLDAEPTGTFLPKEEKEIINAVLKHSNRNGPDDSLVLITLMDADRLVNLEADCIIRNGQYFGNALQVVDPVYLLDDPKANFRDPRSILWTMPTRFDWEQEGGFVGLRLPKAREFAKRRFAFWRLFIQETIEQIKESGAVPFPDFES